MSNQFFLKTLSHFTSNQLKTEIIDPAGQTNASAKNNSEIEFLKHLFTTKFGHREDKVVKSRIFGTQSQILPHLGLIIVFI